MGQGDLARDFGTSEGMKNAGILDVFPIFYTARLGQKIRRSPQLPLCGVALRIFLPMTNQNQQVTSLPIDRKMLLSIREAAEYSNIGINKIDELLKQPNCPFVLYVGTKKLVKRRAFEEFIEGRVAI